MLCISICADSEEELKQDFAVAKQYGDLVEIRLDADIPFSLLEAFIAQKPLLLTAKHSHRELAALGPSYLDIPISMPKELFSTIAKDFPEVKIIASYHNFEETPDLDHCFKDLLSFPAHMYKCVCMAKNVHDGVRMLHTVQRQKKDVIGFCMGEIGSFTRLLAKDFGSKISYVGLAGKPTAPGQFTVEI